MSEEREVKSAYEVLTLSIAKAKIKNPSNEWKKYLADKVLYVGKFGKGYNLLGIEGTGEEFRELCKIAWDNEPEEEHEYDRLDDFIGEMLEGNDGFGFDADEIEIIEKCGDWSKRFPLPSDD